MTQENKLKKIIKQNKTIAYTGKFGTGKTTFLSEKILGDVNIDSLLFNAWEFDFSDSPKVTFINEVALSIYRTFNLKNNAHKKLMDVFKLTKNFTKNATLKKLEKLYENEDEIEFKKRIENYKSEREILNSLREGIKKLAEERERDGNGLVLIIDDLDRARPDFALEIFEISKHIFDIDNFTMIFVFDKEAMENMIEKKYGKYKGESYLEKYIHIWFDHEDAVLDFSNNHTNESMVYFFIDRWHEPISIRRQSKFFQTYDFNKINNFGLRFGDESIWYVLFIFVKLIDNSLLQYRRIDNKYIMPKWEKLVSLINYFADEKTINKSSYDKLKNLANKLSGEYVSEDVIYVIRGVNREMTQAIRLNEEK